MVSVKRQYKVGFILTASSELLPQLSKEDDRNRF